MAKKKRKTKEAPDVKAAGDLAEISEAANDGKVWQRVYEAAEAVAEALASPRDGVPDDDLAGLIEHYHEAAYEAAEAAAEALSSHRESDKIRSQLACDAVSILMHLTDLRRCLRENLIAGAVETAISLGVVLGRAQLKPYESLIRKGVKFYGGQENRKAERQDGKEYRMALARDLLSRLSETHRAKGKKHIQVEIARQMSENLTGRARKVAAQSPSGEPITITVAAETVRTKYLKGVKY